MFQRVPWGHTLEQVLPPAVLILAVLTIALMIVRNGLQRDLLVWIALAVAVVLVWPSSIDPVSDHFATASWAFPALVVPGIALAAVPLWRRIRGADDPPQPDRSPPESP